MNEPARSRLEIYDLYPWRLWNGGWMEAMKDLPNIISPSTTVSPDEPAGINELREQLRQQFPKNAVQVGKYFVIEGEPAFIALSSYYHAMMNVTSLSDEFRAYMGECLERITTNHRTSQAMSINLREGQLSHDPRLEFLACVAMENGQILLSSDR